MGFYLESSEIADTKGLTAEELDTIIATIENNVEFYCQDIFRPRTLYRFVNGSGSQNLYPSTGYNNISKLDIVSISKVEWRSENGSFSEILATEYWHNKFKLMLLSDGAWSWGKLNYKLQFTLGHEATDFEDNTDPRYLPPGIKIAVHKIMLNFLENNYETTEGMESSEGPYKSASIGGGDFSYTIIDSLLNLDSDSPTGFVDIDSILVSLRRRRLTVTVLQPNPRKYNVRPW